MRPVIVLILISLRMLTSVGTAHSQSLYLLQKELPNWINNSDLGPDVRDVLYKLPGFIEEYQQAYAQTESMRSVPSAWRISFFIWPQYCSAAEGRQCTKRLRHYMLAHPHDLIGFQQAAGPIVMLVKDRVNPYFDIANIDAPIFLQLYQSVTSHVREPGTNADSTNRRLASLLLHARLDMTVTHMIAAMGSDCTRRGIIILSSEHQSDMPRVAQVFGILNANSNTAQQ